MILDKNQKNNQDVQKLVSLINDDEISYLIEQNLITLIEKDDKKIYMPTEKLKSFIKTDKNYFDKFYESYPIFVTRPDGTKSYLRINVNKCRNLFNTICGNSSEKAEHLIKCLQYEVSARINNGSLQYMKHMWNWLVGHVWEESEQEMEESEKQDLNKLYGDEIL